MVFEEEEQGRRKRENVLSDLRAQAEELTERLPDSQ